MGVIYKATNNINGKVYIGQTNNFSRRKREHIAEALRNLPKDYSLFHKAIRKYGPDNFSWEIIEEIPNDILDEREKYWIAYYDSYIANKLGKGYNLTPGGDNAAHLEEWRQNNPDLAKQNALNGLQYAQESNRLNKDRLEKHLQKARAKSNQVVSKKVRCIELDIIFQSLSKAEEWSLSTHNPNGKKASHQHISKVCKGTRHTAGGYHWEYVD